MAKKRKIKVWNEVITFIDEVIQNSEKLTRRSIEEKLHLSRGMISRCVKGNGSPTLDKILNILNVMDIEMTLEFKGDVETKILAFLIHFSLICVMVSASVVCKISKTLLINSPLCSFDTVLSQSLIALSINWLPLSTSSK